MCMKSSMPNNNSLASTNTLSRSTRDAQGFTLIEMMVVIGVLGILIFFFSSSGVDRGTVTHNALASTAHTLEGSLNFAREKSIARGGNVVVSAINNNWADGWTITPPAPEPAKVVQSKFSSMNGNTIVKTGNASITFNNGSSSDLSSFILCNFERSTGLTRHHRVITVNMVGRVRIFHGDEVNTQYDCDGTIGNN